MSGLATRWFELSARELRVLLAAAAIVLLSLLAVEGIRRLTWRGELRVENARETIGLPARIDVNAAKDYELCLLPGIGEKTAKAIIDYRDEHGPFERIEDLQRVRGIGPKTVERLRPHLMCVPPSHGEEDEFPRPN